MHPDIVVNCDLWTQTLSDIDAFCARLTQACKAHLPQLADDSVEWCVNFSDDDEISALNGDFRGKNAPTNVLSFPAEEVTPVNAEETKSGYLGDVIISYGAVKREAEEDGLSFNDHASHLWIHGLLHLVGYDHEKAKDAEIMEALEIKILADLNIDSPF